MNGNLAGMFHINPMLSTKVYLAAFLDGHIKEHSANLIVEVIYTNVDDDGNDELLFYYYWA